MLLIYMMIFCGVLFLAAYLLNKKLCDLCDPSSKKELEEARKELILKLETLDNKREIAKINTQIRRLDKKLSKFN